MLLEIGNVIGGGDFSENRIIPIFIKVLNIKILKIVILNLLGYGSIFLDLITGYLKLIEKL